jgi:catechol 2,3-dioxygenase-like lactoylglutathione lyase family enzyme
VPQDAKGGGLLAIDVSFFGKAFLCHPDIGGVYVFILGSEKSLFPSYDQERFCVSSASFASVSFWFRIGFSSEESLNFNKHPLSNKTQKPWKNVPVPIANAPHAIVRIAWKTTALAPNAIVRNATAAKTQPNMLIAVNPKLPMRNAAVTKKYYTDQLGFVLSADYGNYLIFDKDEVEIHFFEFEDLDPLENYGQVYLRTNDIDGLYRSFLDRGVAIHPNAPLQTKPWGQREFALLDPDHNLLTFAQGV